MNKIACMILIGCLALPFTAESSDRRYFVFGVGVDLPGEDINAPVYFTDMGVQADINNGIILYCGGGFQIMKNLRIEGEVAYRSNSLDDIKITYINVYGVGVDGGRGDTSCFSFMANLWYDIIFEDRLVPIQKGLII